MRLLDGNVVSVLVNFAFCSGYLLWGYYVTLSEEYAFEWTIPQCVLTLRLIAVSFDVYDGHVKRKSCDSKSSSDKKQKKFEEMGGRSREEKGADVVHETEGNHVPTSPPAETTSPSTASSSPVLSSPAAAQSQAASVTTSSSSKGKATSDARQKAGERDENPEALTEVPGLLPLLAHSYFPASFLVGPQFGLHVYLNFVQQEDSFLPKNLIPGIHRLALGVLYMIAFQIGSLILPHTYLVTNEFRETESFAWKVLLMTVIAKVQLCKYICIWLISEGSCVVSGVTYDREKDSCDKCSNVFVLEYETTSTFGGIIHSFNVTTNQWSGKYVFKRLKFLRSKFLSHLLTLVYLALWHGWKSGYYVTFTIELLIMKTEREVMGLVSLVRKKYRSVDDLLSASYVYWPIRVLFRVYTLVVFGYCLIPFILLSYSKWFDVLSQFYFFPHLIYVPFNLIVSPLVLPFLTRRLRLKDEAEGKKKA